MSIEKRIEGAEKICQQAGVQFTSIRKAVLTLIYQQNKHITAYKLLDLLSNMNQKVQSMTVYRTLEFLQKQHLIHRIDTKNAYIACDSPHELHHAILLLCEKCCDSKEIITSVLKKAAKKIVDENHFLLSSKPIELAGICKKCAHSD
jgi:Fur family zinc uptake transcriptional regulator